MENSEIKPQREDGAEQSKRVYVAHYQGTLVTDTAVELSMGFNIS